MSKTLILCEKPSQAQDFTKGLSENFKKEKGYYESDSYIICYARGHLIRLYEPEEYDETYKEWSFDRLPIIPDKFCYQVSEGDSSQLFNIISGQLNRSDVSKIVVATDAEREGELIARLILDAAGIPQHDDRLYRFWTSGALTPKEITASLEKIKPLNEYNRLYIAAKARQQADWLIGINATRAATIQAGGGVVSIGRVQTPTLNLLVKR
ncbi:MAG: DNA topoisomerase III, partial [Deferribacterales bacterium]|nr:DNA topoisomerase III [Deferribacterales bacterium]